ncbi:MAG: 30S ribosomal protein S27ae [Promethearchaeota archaeon]
MAKKRDIKTKTKKKGAQSKNKQRLWVVEDGKVKRTHHECPRCGPGVFMAIHYSRISCGRCGYTKFNAPTKTLTQSGQKTIGGVKTVRRRRKKLQK